MDRAVDEEAEATEMARENGPFGNQESKMRTESQEDKGAEVKSKEKGVAVLPTRSVLRTPCAFRRHQHPTRRAREGATEKELPGQRPPGWVSDHLCR